MPFPPLLSPHSDLYITVAVWAGSKPLTMPIRTAYKAFRTERKYVTKMDSLGRNPPC